MAFITQPQKIRRDFPGIISIFIIDITWADLRRDSKQSLINFPRLDIPPPVTRSIHVTWWIAWLWISVISTCSIGQEFLPSWQINKLKPANIFRLHDHFAIEYLYADLSQSNHNINTITLLRYIYNRQITYLKGIVSWSTRIPFLGPEEAGLRVTRENRMGASSLSFSPLASDENDSPEMLEFKKSSISGSSTTPSNQWPCPGISDNLFFWGFKIFPLYIPTEPFFYRIFFGWCAYWFNNRTIFRVCNGGTLSSAEPVRARIGISCIFAA